MLVRTASDDEAANLQTVHPASPLPMYPDLFLILYLYMTRVVLSAIACSTQFSC